MVEERRETHMDTQIKVPKSSLELVVPFAHFCCRTTLCPFGPLTFISNHIPFAHVFHSNHIPFAHLTFRCRTTCVPFDSHIVPLEGATDTRDTGESAQTH